MKSEPTSFLPLIIFGTLGVLVFRSMDGGSPAPQPPPDPTPVVASEHLIAALEYGAALQQHIKGTIAKLQAGELTDEQQTRDWLQTGRTAALKASFMPVADRDAAAFADGWTVEKQIARLKAMITPGS